MFDTRNESDIVDSLRQRVELGARVTDGEAEGTVVGFRNWDLDQYPAVIVDWDDVGQDTHPAMQRFMDDNANCEDITIVARASRRDS